MIETLLQGLARVNLVAAAAVLLVLLLRRPVRGAFGAQATYLLWLAPPLAVLASLLPEAPAGQVLASPALKGALPALPDVSQTSAAPMVLAAWAAGVLATAGLMGWRQARFVASLGRLAPAGDGVMRAERPGVGPALVGALRPRIVTPADFETRFAPHERALVLSHEAAHLQRGDALANAAVAAVQCLCWFNPLVHLGAQRLRVDQELACDAAVLAQHPRARRAYAEALLKTQLSPAPLPLGCHWPAGGVHPLRERIAMLKRPLPSRPRRFAGLALAVGASLGGACAAWAAQPAAGHLITAPVWTAKPTGADVQRLDPPDDGGSAMIACRVDREGRLHACRVLRQTGPAHGQLAMRMTPLFRMAPKARTGIETRGGVVHIPIRYVVPQ